MKINLVQKCIFISFLILLQSFSYAQIIEKDGLFYRNKYFITDTTTQTTNKLQSINKQFEYPIEPTIIKDDFQINTLGGDYGANQSNIFCALSEIGYSASVWMDERNGLKDIYAQFFDPAGNKIGSNIKVSDYPSDSYLTPTIATNNKGEFIISWTQNSYNVVAQKFDKNGQKIGGQIYVNQISGYISSISAAIHSNSSFMIMWGLSNGSYYQIYARYFDSTGTASGPDILINDPFNYLTSIGGGKFISVDGDGNYVICWSSASGENYSKIFLQRLNHLGQKIDNNILVSQNSDSTDCYFPEISTTNDGYSFIIWHNRSRYGFGSGVYARIFNFNQSFVADEFTISQRDAWGDLFCTSTDHDSAFLFIHSSSTRPYFRRIDKYGNFNGDTVGVTYNENNARYIDLNNLSNMYQNKVLIAVNTSDRNDQNVYLQSYDFNFNPINGFNKQNDDVNSSKQRYPVIKFNQQGNSLVIWEDRRNGKEDLYGQLYDSTFSPITDNFIINDEGTDNFILRDKKITSLSDGSFVVAFIGSSDYNEKKIWLQAISNAGEKVGSNILIKDNYYNYHFNIKVKSNDDDEILICWFNQYGAYLKSFDKNLNVIKGEKNFLPPPTNYRFQNIDVSMDADLNIFASWQRYDLIAGLTENKIYGAFYDKSGIVTKPGFLIDSLNRYSDKIFCANDGNDFVLIYKEGSYYQIIRDYESNNNARYKAYVQVGYYYFPEIDIINFENRKLLLTYFQYPTVSGLFLNDNKREVLKYNLFPLSFTVFDYEDNLAPYALDINNRKLFNVFESNINPGTNIDIWGNVTSLSDINFTDEFFYQPVYSDHLYNNFPNPFNSKTKIVYELLAYHNVKLAVYNVLGEEVKVLVNQSQDKGIYEVEFDASGLSSGVYFYRLDAFDTTIKKMIILK